LAGSERADRPDAPLAERSHFSGSRFRKPVAGYSLYRRGSAGARRKGPRGGSDRSTLGEAAVAASRPRTGPPGTARSGRA
jgi:hypothetical protein